MATRKSSSGSTTKSASKSGAAKKPAAPRKPRKGKVSAGSVGLSAEEVGEGQPTKAMIALAKAVVDAGGVMLSSYREPLGGNWVGLAALPIAAVKPTPYQRELSKAHADKLAAVIPKVGRFLDPVIAVPDGDGFISPNGMHRLTAMTALGAKTIIALVMPEPEIAFRILALNTEKAHNLKDKALEVIRMVRALGEKDADKTETDYAFELEQPGLVTIGICYEKNAKFSGGAYNSVVTKCESWSTDPLAESIELREGHADKLLELDELVGQCVVKLKAAGWTSGYLKPIVVARINPLRFTKLGKDERADFDKTLDKMIEGAKKFDASKVKAADMVLAATVGGGDEGGES